MNTEQILLLMERIEAASKVAVESSNSELQIVKYVALGQLVSKFIEHFDDLRDVIRKSEE